MLKFPFWRKSSSNFESSQTPEFIFGLKVSRALDLESGVELSGRTMFCADCRHHLCGKHFEGIGCLRILNVLGGVGRRPCDFLCEHLPVLLVLMNAQRSHFQDQL